MAIIARPDAEYDVYADAINNTRSGYQPTWGPNAPVRAAAPVVADEDDDAPVAAMVLRPCANPACADTSYATFTSEACRMAVEGPVEVECLGTYTPRAFFAVFQGHEGFALRDASGACWFVAEGQLSTLLHEADLADLTLCGQVDVALAQAMKDTLAGGLLQLVEVRNTHRPRVAA